MTRESAARESDGARAALRWQPRESAVTLSVEDERADRRFEPGFSAGALDAFYNAFAYVA